MLLLATQTHTNFSLDNQRLDLEIVSGLSVISIVSINISVGVYNISQITALYQWHNTNFKIIKVV